MPDCWTNDNLYIYDLSSGEPVFVPGEVTHIDYGPEGTVVAQCPMPLGMALGATPDEGATIVLAVLAHGASDDYENTIPITRITDAKAIKSIDLPLARQGHTLIELEVLWEGNVELLTGRDDDL